jgi:hypothetical protein
MSADEYAAFCLVVQLSDYNTGTWIGSGVALSDYLHWCRRKSQLVLCSLQSKGYIVLKSHRGRKGNYPVIVRNYHGKVANGDASLKPTGAPGCVTSAKVANAGATLKEVIQEKGKEAKPAHNSRGSFPAYAKKPNARELEGFMEIRTENGSARKEYLDFVNLRDAGKIPKGVTWAKWRELSTEERQKIARAA